MAATGEFRRVKGNVIELDGLLWKPRRGTQVTAEEFAAAQCRLQVILAEHDWNRWNREALSAELEQVSAICDQWTRAEKGFRPYTAEELEAHWHQLHEQADARYAERERVRSARRGQYDEALFTARLAWIEKQSILDQYLSERGTSLGRKLYPDLEERIPEVEIQIADLCDRVGDPELVVDRNGWLPAERRERMYWEFRCWRNNLIDDLIEQILQRMAAMKLATDRSEKSSIRNEIGLLTSNRDALMAIPEPLVEEMCSECPLPFNWHGWRTNGVMALLGAGPCPAWPAGPRVFRKPGACS